MDVISSTAAGKPEWVLVLNRFDVVVIITRDYSIGRHNVVVGRSTCKESTMAQAGRTSGDIGPCWLFLALPFMPHAARMFGQHRTSRCLSKDSYYVIHKPAGRIQHQVCSNFCRAVWKKTYIDKHWFFFDKARLLLVTYFFYGGFSQLRMNLPKRLCRFRHGIVISENALSFPTSALSEIREFRNWIIHVTACRPRVPAFRCERTKKNRFHKHRQGQLPGTISRRSYRQNSFCPDLLILGRVFRINKREWITCTASYKILRDVAYCSCSWDEKHPITPFHVVNKRCSVLEDCSSWPNHSSGDFANGNEAKFVCKGYWVPSTLTGKIVVRTDGRCTINTYPHCAMKECD